MQKEGNNSIGDSSGGDMQFLNDLSLDNGEEMVDEEDETELFQDLDKRKEEILEEFLEYAFAKKHEKIEEVKANCKKNKTPRDQEKKLVQETQHKMDQLRKDGLIDLTKRMNEIISDDEISLNEKIERLQDKE